MRHRVVVATPLVPEARSRLDDDNFDVVVSDDPPANGEQLREVVSGADALVCSLANSVDASVFEAAPSLKVVSNVAVGFDNIDLDAARRCGVVVCNTPGVLDAATADLTMLLVLAVCRRLRAAIDLLETRRWDGFDLSSVLGRDVGGLTIGLIGYGRIGRAVASRARAFEMQVVHHTRHDTGEPGFLPNLDELLVQSDIVSLHVPLTASTRHLLDARRLALMPAHAVLINTARGACVEESALADALEGGRLAGAGLDVFEDEPELSERLRVAPNVVLTPHIGSATVETRTKMALMAVDAVREVLAGHPYPHVVQEAWKTAGG